MKRDLQTTANIYTAIAFAGLLLTTLALLYTYYYTDRVVYSLLAAYLVPIATGLYAMHYQVKAREAQQQRVAALAG